MNRCAIFLHLLLALVALIEATKEDQMRLLTVRKCPRMPIMRSVEKEKLLGVWYAYASTPLPFERYQRQCSSYNVKDSPYFATNILYTNYRNIVITYSCTPKDDNYIMKLRILTRTRRPIDATVNQAMRNLKKVNFPIAALNILQIEAFCFEWYQLKFETQRRPITYQAPFNVHGE